ncbi:MAG: MBL fold metallo-hydrolase [Dehalococcoidia bacterium]|nr:MBL fold metallo-hydrolase [Dehalococcoidia bacterium]
MSEPAVTEVLVRGLVVGLFQENCWVIGNRRSGEAICIDPGDQADDILHMAAEMGVKIKVIANSHAHIDHILGVPGIKAAGNTDFYLHRGDLEIARGAAAKARNFMGEVEQPPDPDHFPEHGDVIEVDGVSLRVLHTPGHTPGSLSYFGNGMLFSGDTLFRGSIGRTDLPGGDLQQEMASIVDTLLALPDDTVVLPGHMDETRIETERRTNPFILQELARRSGQSGY